MCKGVLIFVVFDLCEARISQLKGRMFFERVWELVSEGNI
jgi:hypothetical protein